MFGEPEVLDIKVQLSTLSNQEHDGIIMGNVLSTCTNLAGIMLSRNETWKLI